VYHGNGGYDWHTVYNMPIWLRKFTINKITMFLEEKNEAQQKANNKMSSTGKGTSRQIDFAAPPADIKPGQRI